MHRRASEHGWPFTVLVGTFAVPTEPDGNAGMPAPLRSTVTSEVIHVGGKAFVGRIYHNPDIPIAGAAAQFEVLNNSFAFPSSLILGDYELVSNVDFVVGVGVNDTAANIATAIGRLPGYEALSGGAVVTVFYDAGARDVVELRARNFGVVANFGNFVTAQNTDALFPGNPGYASPLIA